MVCFHQNHFLSSPENGSDPDLSFLSSIQEVSGYVYLSRNSVRTISLPSLRVIRGEPPLTYNDKNASFVATRNGLNLTNALEVVNMPNLTGEFNIRSEFVELS